MSIETYAIHIAPKTGRIASIIDGIWAQRKEALAKRWEFAKSKGATGLYHHEKALTGLIFDNDSAIPEGWAKDFSQDSGFVAIPKAKDRTKIAREKLKADRAELAALPPMFGSREFSAQIGCGEIFRFIEGRFAISPAYFERVGDVTFVMTPWTTKADERGDNMDHASPTLKNRIAFLPDECERVGLSVYYAEKEKQQAKKAAEVAA
jgi:hypothetical protein